MVAEPLPIFPLESVLVPGALLPLRVFEPRYQALLRDIADDPEFGSVLIERGSEVGGGDARLPIGTIGQIVSTSPRSTHTDIVIVGTQRFTVIEWLDDDPYPRANVSIIDEPGSEPEDHGRVEAVKRQWEAVNDELVAMKRSPLPSLDEVAEDPALFSFQAAALAPMGPLDRYQIVQARRPSERLAHLEATLRDLCTVLEKARQLE